MEVDVAFGRGPMAPKRSADDCMPLPHKNTSHLDKEPDVLCGTCKNIDFPAFFKPKSKPNKLCKISHVLDCFNCPFCMYVAAQLHKNFRNPAGLEEVLTLIQNRLSPANYPRTSGIDISYRLGIVLSHHSGPRLELASLELYGSLPDQERGTAYMSRVPLEDKFNPDLLRAWLRDNTKPYKKSQIREGLGDLTNREKFRVLDVNSGDVIIVNSAVRYVALSYVWGRTCTEIDNAICRCTSAFRRQNVFWNVNIEELPATVKDAIDLLRQLGERYLWVDALCIDQQNLEDKAALVSAMDRIYQNACYTIVAADGNDANAGLRRLQSYVADAEKPLSMLQNGKQLSFLPQLPSYQHALEKTLWNTRGWTYQEMMLSSVSVIFTPGEVFLVSPRGIERESCRIESSLPANGSVTQSSRNRRTGMKPSTQQFLLRKNNTTREHLTDSFRDAYTIAVMEYTRRQLTYQSDRLDAFSGVLSAFYSRTPFYQEPASILGGIIQLEPYMNIFFDWYILVPSRRIWSNSSGTGPLPSWSWSGWSGAVSYGGKLPDCKLAILDDKNILLESVELGQRELNDVERWPYRPDPSAMSPSFAIVLHMWVPIIICNLFPCIIRGLSEKLAADLSYYDVVPNVQPQVDRVRIVLDRSVVAASGPDACFEFVGLGGYVGVQWEGYLMPVLRCGDGDFVERWAPVISWHVIFDCAPELLNYQHVRMI